MTSTPKCSKKRRSSVASVALIKKSGSLIERHRVVAEQSALADLVAESVEKVTLYSSDKVHLALGEARRRGWRRGEHDKQAADAKRQTLAGEVVEDADDACAPQSARRRWSRRSTSP